MSFLTKLFAGQQTNDSRIDISGLTDEAYEEYIDEREEMAWERLKARESKAEKIGAKERKKLDNFRKS